MSLNRRHHSSNPGGGRLNIFILRLTKHWYSDTALVKRFYRLRWKACHEIKSYNLSDHSCILSIILLQTFEVNIHIIEICSYQRAVGKLIVNERIFYFLLCRFWYSFRSSSPEVFLWKGVLKICRKFTREHPYRNLILIKLLCLATLLKSHFGMGVLL